MPRTDRRDLALSLVVCTMLLALVWAEPRPLDAVFIALAGGRDIFAGRLGGPDDWSFMTSGRVWLDQSWGSHAFFYAVHARAGEMGLLALKALLLVTGTAALAATARARGVSWPLALVVGALTFAASRSYVDLQPSLVGLVFASGLLAVLARADTRPSRLWLGVALLAVWANAHASFVFGLGLLLFWISAFGAMQPRVLPSALAAFGTALALAAFANPFGLENLTQPFVVGLNPGWQEVGEWAPLFTADATTAGGRWEILTIAASFALVLLARLVAARRAPSETEGDPRAARARIAFDAAAIVVVAIMAIRARRFVPLALIVLSAPLAVQLAWWERRLGTSWPTRVLALALAVGVATAAPPVLRRYRADNPVFVGLSPFERMIDAPTFPRDAVEFLRANGIGGRAYAAWEWEGFLRWAEAPVTVFIGGRAQQVYDETTLALQKDLLSGAAKPVDVLAARDVGLAILPMTPLYSVPLGGLVYQVDSSWTYLYCDGRHVVLGDTSHPALAATVAALDAGALRYPSPAIATTSRLMYLATTAANAEVAAVRSAAEEAAVTAPNALAYALIGDISLADRSSTASTRAYLAGERARLAALAAEHGEDLALAKARLSVARTEAALVGRTVDPEGVQRARDEVALRTRAMQTLLTTWAYGWDPNIF